MAAGLAHSRLIARLQAIASLSSEDAALLEDLPISVQKHQAGKALVREGDVVDRCCILLDGYLFRHKEGLEGRRQIISWHVPGDIPDLHSLHLSPMDHNISTLGPAVVGFIPHAPFLEILGRSSRLAHVFWRETLVDSSVFREWVVNLGQRDALNRVAHMLCEIATRLQAVGLARKDFSFTFPALQTDIADAVGISPVHANRIIQDLRTKQLIEWKGKEIRIIAWRELVLLADFDDGYLHLR